MTNEHIIDLVHEQRLRLLEEVRGIMLLDPILASFEAHLTLDLLYPQPEAPDLDPRARLLSWVGQGDKLTVSHAAVHGKFSLVGFRVVDFRLSDLSVMIDEITVDLVLYVYISRVGPDPFPIHIITPEHDKPVRYRHILGTSRGDLLESIDISVTDLLNRFPGQVENILNQIAFLAQVFLGLVG